MSANDGLDQGLVVRLFGRFSQRPERRPGGLGVAAPLAADEAVALGSCQCRLTIFVSVGEIAVGTSGTNESIECDADGLGISRGT
jgi:hypothetical protein